MGARALLLAAALAACLAAATANQEVMKTITIAFGKALDECREESHLTEEKIEEFFHFWREDFKFDMRELGCALQCMSRSYNLLTDSSRMEHGNTLQFLNSIPNGELLARKIVDMIYECEKQFDHEEDHCWRILHVAECFKNGAVREGIAPTMEVAIAEFIMEVEPH